MSNSQNQQTTPRQNTKDLGTEDEARSTKETRSTQLFCMENPNLSAINRLNLNRQRYVFTDSLSVSDLMKF